MPTSSISQLKEKLALPQGTFSIKNWLRHVGKLLDQASEKGDLETAYINNIKASTIILETIPNHKDYGKMSKEEKIEFMAFRNNGKLKDILAKAEEAGKKLQERENKTSENQGSEVTDSHMQMPVPHPTPDSTLNITRVQTEIPKINNAAPRQTIYPQTPPVTALSFETTTTKQNIKSSSPKEKSPLDNLPASGKIEASILRGLLDMVENPPRVLVLDVRHRVEFDYGHIKTKNIVCIEPIILKEGISAIDLESKLIVSPEHEQKLFADRHNFDLIVYHDEDSSYIPISTLNKGNTSDDNKNVMTHLIQAICQNEFKKHLKREPLWLNGGFKAWSRVTGESGIERNINNTRANKYEIDTDRNPSNTLSVKRNFLDFFQQPCGLQAQSMTESSYSSSPTSNLLYNSSLYNSNFALPQNTTSSQTPISVSTSTTTQSGYSLKRRKTVFDHPYHGFSEIKNPEYAPPLPPKKLETTSDIIPSKPSNVSLSNTSTNSSEQMTMQHNSSLISDHRFPQSESSFSKLGSGIGITGLRNLGNTCFMNSVIQCLSGTLPFARYFLDGSFKQHINKSNPLGTKGVLAEAFAKLIQVMWGEQYTFVSPVTFKEAIGRFAPQFSGSDQQDSQEFLAYLLDGLHEDLNIITNKPIFSELTSQEEEQMELLPPQMASEIEWEKYLLRNSSVVVSLFQGQFRNKLMCLTCEKTSSSYNAFMYLSLPIPTNIKDGEPIDLEMCLKCFTKEEILEGDDAWNCPRCKCFRRATKQLTISRLPDILLIHLKRFSFDGPFRDKLETKVHFPLKNLDLTSYVPPPIPKPTQIGAIPKTEIPGTGGSLFNLQQTGPFIYDLYAVSNHFGGLNGGHYTACVRNRHEWHTFDDSRVSVCDERNVMTRSAYSLFYVRTSI